MAGEVEGLCAAGDTQPQLRAIAGGLERPLVLCEETSPQCDWRSTLAVNPSNDKRPRVSEAAVSTATGIRTRVSAMRGRRPSPLDDSGANSCVEATKALRTIADGAASLAAARPRARAAQGRQRPSASAISSLPYPRGCGGIGRRARFRSVSGQPGGGSSPLIRIRTPRLPNTFERRGGRSGSVRARSPRRSTSRRARERRCRRRSRPSLRAGRCGPSRAGGPHRRRPAAGSLRRGRAR
jgi:hypothetical protein